LAQLIEQPQILDGDHSLCSEVLDQIDLLVGERPYFLPVNANNPDQLVLLDHRHGNNRAVAPEICSCDHEWIAPAVRFALGAVEHLSHPFRGRGLAKRAPGIRLDQPVLAGLDECQRSVVERLSTKRIPIAQIERTKLGPAYACRARQYGLKNRFKLPWRTADDVEHLGRCSLLLERLIALAL
jgi:hypothetical protein